ncbi:OLC1v1002823C1 [Oldenlandia corymbosa var. corymbosa]|uniref:OLC1v1002823C1 n=1 Tax=Oldenlandia corymbosa var. corymbosa TaxID=529605 RepID=A0AAV1D8L7_OLDCO|nr:OLC1v1002823C1 [Oldenlandia corymbosa var. corymbosa]
MEGRVSEPAHVIEVDDDDRALAQKGGGGSSKVCEGSPCGFSDGKKGSSSERSVSMKKLWVGIVLCIVFMAVEIVGGIKANSLAIMTDAAHLLSDVAAFGISLFSVWASGWEANPRQSYGFFRIEILGALVSIQIIWLLAGILVYEAISRLLHGTGEVAGFLMFLVSAFGLLVNIIMALVLGHDHGHHHHHSHGHEDHHHDHDHSEPLLQQQQQKSGGIVAKRKKRFNINVEGAYLHVIGDSIQSIGVMIGGAIIWYKPEWKFVDLICTLVFSLIVLGTTINMLRNILEVLMESTPREIDATTLKNGLCQMEEVVAIHELHIWAITVGKVLLACHVKITPDSDPDLVLDKVIGYINTEYNISHVTIQIERGEYD